MADMDYISIIRSDLSRLELKVEGYVEGDVEAHEKLSDSLTSMKDELHLLNVNMATYNAHLAEHMRRTELSEQRQDSLEEFSKELANLAKATHLEIEKMKAFASGVTKVIIAAAGSIGVVWTVIQIIGFFVK